MPSSSPKQAKLMAAAAHTKGGYDGVPQKVGKEFAAADKAKPKKQPAKDGLGKMASGIKFIGG